MANLSFCIKFFGPHVLIFLRHFWEHGFFRCFTTPFSFDYFGNLEEIFPHFGRKHAREQHCLNTRQWIGIDWIEYTTRQQRCLACGAMTIFIFNLKLKNRGTCFTFCNGFPWWIFVISLLAKWTHDLWFALAWQFWHSHGWALGQAFISFQNQHIEHI